MLGPAGQNNSGPVAIDRAHSFAALRLGDRAYGRGDLFGAELARRVQEMLELHLAIAQHVRVGRTPGGILGEEMGEHAFPVFGGEIAEVERNPQLPADRYRVAAVLLGTAIATADRFRRPTARDGGSAGNEGCIFRPACSGIALSCASSSASYA